MMANFRELSKQNWTGDNSAENINIGSLQRIADATEVMSKNYVQLQNDRDMYKRWNNEKNDHISKLEKSNAALRGHIKRLKRLASFPSK